MGGGQLQFFYCLVIVLIRSKVKQNNKRFGYVLNQMGCTRIMLAFAGFCYSCVVWLGKPNINSALCAMRYAIVTADECYRG